MELTHSYKHKTTTATVRTSVQQALLKFINNHADTFEALTRNTGPYGGNWRLTHQYGRAQQSGLATREQLNQVQKQVDELTKRMARLSDQINQNAPVSSSQASPNEIGINRFRSSRASL